MLTTIHGRRGYLATREELNDLYSLLYGLEDIDVPPDCGDYYEALELSEMWSLVLEELDMSNPLSYNPDEVIFNLTFDIGGDENPFSAVQLADPDIAPYLTGQYSAFVPEELPSHLATLRANVPQLIRGLCPAEPSPWPWIAGAVGIGVFAMTAYLVSRKRS